MGSYFFHSRKLTQTCKWKAFPPPTQPSICALLGSVSLKLALPIPLPPVSIPGGHVSEAGPVTVILDLCFVGWLLVWLGFVLGLLFYFLRLGND